MKVVLKKAQKSDCKLLFDWANDEDVRNNAFNPKKIEYAEHLKWFNQKIEDKNVSIFIVYLEDKPVGQIRIEKKNKIGVISYSVDNEHRGIGIGTKILKQIKVSFDKRICSIEGYVKIDNLASRRAFVKAGYKEKIEGDVVKYSCEMFEEKR